MISCIIYSSDKMCSIHSNINVLQLGHNNTIFMSKHSIYLNPLFANKWEISYEQTTNVPTWFIRKNYIWIFLILTWFWHHCSRAFLAPTFHLSAVFPACCFPRPLGVPLSSSSPVMLPWYRPGVPKRWPRVSKTRVFSSI